MAGCDALHYVVRDRVGRIPKDHIVGVLLRHLLEPLLLTSGTSLAQTAGAVPKEIGCVERLSRVHVGEKVVVRRFDNERLQGEELMRGRKRVVNGTLGTRGRCRWLVVTLVGSLQSQGNSDTSRLSTLRHVFTHRKQEAWSG